MTLAAERLDDKAQHKLVGLLAAGDPDGEVHEAWATKEALRELYTMWRESAVAEIRLDGLIDDCRAA